MHPPHPSSPVRLALLALPFAFACGGGIADDPDAAETVDTAFDDGGTDGPGDTDPDDGSDEAVPDGDDAAVDAGDTDDGGTDDGEADAGVPVVQGRVTYLRRPLGGGGLGAPMPEPAGGVRVVLATDGGEWSRTETDAEGRYRFELEPPGLSGAFVRVTAASQTPHPLSVTDFDGGVYAVRSDRFEAAGPVAVDLEIPLEANAGAFAIHATLHRGLADAAAGFGRPEAFPPLVARWERGRTTPYGTSYLSGTEIWLLGGPDDTDEFDAPVVAHEEGHFLQTVYRMTSPGEGYPHAGADTDPRYAWSEGWASFFSSAVREDSRYLDSYGEVLGIAMDLGALPLEGEFLARTGEPVTQSLSEWLVAGTLWALRGAGEPAAQEARSFAVIRDWFSRWPTPDRARPGYDLVDFLDGYLCLHARTDEAVIRSWLVTGRRFPYDLAPVCGKRGAAGEPGDPIPGPACRGKPGRPCLATPRPVPEDRVYRGRRTAAEDGTPLREVTLIR